VSTTFTHTVYHSPSDLTVIDRSAYNLTNQLEILTVFFCF